MLSKKEKGFIEFYSDGILNNVILEMLEIESGRPSTDRHKDGYTLKSLNTVPRAVCVEYYALSKYFQLLPQLRVWESNNYVEFFEVILGLNEKLNSWAFKVPNIDLRFRELDMSLPENRFVIRETMHKLRDSLRKSFIAKVCFGGLNGDKIRELWGGDEVNLLYKCNKRSLNRHNPHFPTLNLGVSTDKAKEIFEYEWLNSLSSMLALRAEYLLPFEENSGMAWSRVHYKTQRYMKKLTGCRLVDATKKEFSTDVEAVWSS